MPIQQLVIWTNKGKEWIPLLLKKKKKKILWISLGSSFEDFGLSSISMVLSEMYPGLSVSHGDMYLYVDFTLVLII